jgi:IclR family acetate operon transcriptional repressor
MSSVQSVDRALAILRALGSGPAGVTELADRVGLAKSTVSRMLTTLERQGAVEQTVDGPYRLGPLISEIAAAAAPARGIVDVARPVLAELAAATGEAVLVAVREGAVVRFWGQTRQHGEVQVRDWSGSTSPLHVGPSGLVFLAFADPADVEGYLSGPLEAFTERSLTDPDALRHRLAVIRAQGWAWVFGEFSSELNSTAAPIRAADGSVVACINVHGPTYRFPGEADPAALAALVVAAADRVTRALGGTA